MNLKYRVNFLNHLKNTYVGNILLALGSSNQHFYTHDYLPGFPLGKRNYNKLKNYFNDVKILYFQYYILIKIFLNLTTYQCN